MAKKPVLVVMAAGMGSRYGGLKQIDPVGRHGEAILDFSVYDAWEAGFETVVIVIKEAIRADFMETVGARLAASPVEIRYAFQELHKLPQGYTIPEGRVKPWGTSHAVLCAAQAIDGAPFAVINADDYYGKAAYKTMYQALCNARDAEVYDYCMVGYRLDKTVSDHGSVARGICTQNGEGYLTSIVERTNIVKYEDGIRFSADAGASWQELAPDTVVSMNMWGFTPSFLEELEKGFAPFLDRALTENPMKGEYFLPSAVEGLVAAGRAQVRVLTSPDQWYGVTYAADRPVVVQALADMTDQGLYPAGLWK